MPDQRELLPRNEAERQALLDACDADDEARNIPRAAQQYGISRGRAAAEVIQAAAEALERIARGQPLNPMSA